MPKRLERFPTKPKIWVVIPAYRCSRQIHEVVNSIGPEVDRIIVVDDACPERSGNLVENSISDARVKVLYNSINLGVGGAVIKGYRYALEGKADIVVKIDGDGQMDASKIRELIYPILKHEANYTKGNRFHFLKFLKGMPKIRIIGNSILTFVTKISSGYYDINDPNNGYTAIDKFALSKLDFDKVSTRYFFESDMLFHLYSINATVKDVPMPSIYSSEVSSLKIRKVFFTFLSKHFSNTFSRIFQNYFLREINIGSINLLLSFTLTALGFCIGGYSWANSLSTGQLTPAGTVSLASLMIILGAQFNIAFFQFDIQKPSMNKTLSFGD